MNTLYLRIPANHSAIWPNGKLPFALCSKDGAIIREGAGELTELSGIISKSYVVLLIAASDVTLLELTVPPMPESKLKLALPNLVEDQLMSDPFECALLSIKPVNSEDANKRIVAVIQRSWLQQLSSSLYALGASHIKALPAQLCMPFNIDEISVQLVEGEQDSSPNFAMRYAFGRGVGVLLEPNQRAEDRLSIIMLLAPIGPVSLQLPKELVEEYKAAVAASPAWADRITIQESNWLSTIQSIKALTGFNLMASLSSSRASQIQWHVWRWPIGLVIVTLLVNIIGLNVEYWGMKREASALKSGMAATYKASFPKESVVLFPLDQMKKNLGIAQRNSGEGSPTDFTVLLSQFGTAWNSVNPAQLPKIESIEYKDYALIIKIKGSMPQEELQKALSEKDLILKKNNADVWQVRNAE